MKIKYSKNQPQTFLDLYQTSISPTLKEIDVIIKSREENISSFLVSELLCMPKKEIENIMTYMRLKQINSENLLKIMLNGSSYICGILRRELEHSPSEKYSAKDVSYIYNLEYKSVEKAFNFLGLDYISQKALKAIFIQIHL